MFNHNVETSYFTQLKMCYLMTTFRCPSDFLITSWLFTARWSTWPANHLQDKGEQCNSQVSHHRPCRGRESGHRLRKGKSGRQRGTATDQIDIRGTLEQEDMHRHAWIGTQDPTNSATHGTRWFQLCRVMPKVHYASWSASTCWQTGFGQVRWCLRQAGDFFELKNLSRTG